MGSRLSAAELLDLAQGRGPIVEVDKLNERTCENLFCPPPQRHRKSRINAVEITVRLGNAKQVERKIKEAVALRLGLLPLLKIAPHHDIGEAQQAERQQAAEGYESNRRARQLPRFGRALLQEVFLFSRHLGNQVADFIRRLLTLS